MRLFLYLKIIILAIAILVSITIGPLYLLRIARFFLVTDYNDDCDFGCDAQQQVIPMYNELNNASVFDDILLKYQKCKYPRIDPFDPATLSYHNKLKKFTCSAKRHSIIEDEVLRFDTGGVDNIMLYYIIRESDSVSKFEKGIPLLVAGKHQSIKPNSPGYVPQKPCLKECGGKGGRCLSHCGHNGYCCIRNSSDCPPQISSQAPKEIYGCTKGNIYLPGTLIYYKLDKEFLKLTFTDKEGEKWDEYHHAFLKPPNTENNVNDLPNIIMLHIDGASDANVQRQLKKTYAYLKQQKHTVLFKQHSVIGDGTTENMAGFLTGHLVTELPEGRKSMPNGKKVDDWPLIWKEMHKKKYETWFVEEYGPKGGTFHYRLRGFEDPPVKHYYRPLWMILDEMMGKKPLCSAQFHFENLKQYYRTYRNYNKYSLVMLHYLSHDYPSWLSNVDDLILDFYKYLESEGHLNNTVFIMYGDHGNRASSFRGTLQGKLEERNPFLGITVPPWFEQHKEQMRNIRHNADVLTTHFDSYSTLQHIMTFPQENNKTRTPKGASYFSTDFRKLNRTCSDVSIKPHYCLCLNLFSHIAHNDPTTLQAIKNVISYMNGENEKYAGKLCEPLSLHRSIRASKQTGLRGVTNFRVKFVTSPGNGLYEASVTCETVKRKGATTLKQCAAPDISRTNLYGSQPECIRDIAPRLARYCYCKSYKGRPSKLEKHL